VISGKSDNNLPSEGNAAKKISQKSILQNCVLESRNDTPPPRGIPLLVNDLIHCCYLFVPESETSAILSFVQYFSTNFSNRGITFLTCCLEDAFTQAFATSIQRVTRKFVIGKIGLKI
jgi:hypothetical protein